MCYFGFHGRGVEREAGRGTCRNLTIQWNVQRESMFASSYGFASFVVTVVAMVTATPAAPPGAIATCTIGVSRWRFDSLTEAPPSGAGALTAVA